MPIGYRWLPAIVLLLTLVALGTGYVVLGAVEARLVETAGEGLAIAAVDIAEKLDMLLAERYGDIQMMAQADALQGSDRAAMARHLDSLQRAYPVYRWLGVVDAQGRIVASSDPTTVGRSRAGSACFLAVRRTAGIHIQDVERSDLLDGEAVVGFAAPLIGPGGEFRGAVMTHLGLSAIEDIFARTVFPLQAQQGTSGRIEYQFVARDGTLIVDSELHQEAETNLRDLGPRSTTRYREGPPGYVEEDHARRRVPIVTGYARTRGSGEFSGFGWGVLVRRDRADILVPVQELRWKLAAWVSVVFVPTLGFLFWTSSRLKREWARVQAEQTRATMAEASLLVRTEKLESLVESARRLNAQPDLDRLLEHLTEMARRLTGARYAAMGVFAEDGSLSRLITSGMDEATKQAIGRRPAGLGLLGFLAKQEGALRLKDLTQHPAATGFPPHHPPMRSFLGVSIRAHGRVYGRLYLTEKESAGPGEQEFTDIDEQVIIALAAQAGVAIENATLLGELRDAEGRYRLLLQSTQEGIYGVDGDGRCTFVNRAGGALLGYEPDELIGRVFVDVVRPSRHDGPGDPAACCPIARVIETGQGCEAGEVLLSRRDGSQFPARCAVSPIVQEGATVGAVVVLSDRTASKAAEEALRASERTLDTLMSNLPGMAYRCLNDEDWTMLFASRGCLDLTGHPPAAFIERRIAFADLIHADDRDAVWRDVQAALAARQPFVLTYRIAAASGLEKWVWERGRGVYSEDGRLLFLEGFITDMTDRKLAEDALRAAERKLRAVLDHSPAIIFMKDLSGRYLLINKQFERALGVTAERAIGKTDWEIFPTGQAAAFRANDTLVRRSGEPMEFEEVAEQADGPHTSLVLKFPLRDERGVVYAICGIATDITERRALEAQLRQAQKMDAVGRLAGGIAHDFNNLLTVINGYSELLAALLPPGDPLRPHVEQIREAGARAAALTGQLLAFSRRQVLQPRVVNLNEVVRNMEDMLRRLIGEHIALDTALDPGLGRIKADPGQLDQVILNLAVNARDAMPDGGTLTIATANEVLAREPAGADAAVPPGRYVRLTVRDSGCGMDEETRARLFEPFFTTKPKGRGTGLGLSTVYGIVKQSGGTILVASEPGRGATFTIYLPRVEEAPEPAEPEPESASFGGTETILLVEDEAGVRSFARAVLEDCGYRVIEAGDGVEGLRLCEAYGDTIDLVLTDVVMPGLNGRELVERALALCPRAKVLYISGYTDDALGDRGVRQPGPALLPKPFTPAGLARRVREVLDAPRPTG